MDKTRAKYETDVRQFAEVMVRKLIDNSYKANRWEDCSFRYLLDRIQEEIDEVEEALLEQYDPSEVVEECADVANFAMMIADNVMRRAHEAGRSKV